MNNSIKDRYFSPGGELSVIINGYEARWEQAEMAGAVYDSITTGRHLIVEAGTGVGKSMAYLVPLMEALKDEVIERAVVSTYTKALQRQLIEKDIPLLADSLFPDIRYVIALGSENYLCLRRLELSKRHGLFEPADDFGLSELFRWSEETETGLLMEINPPPGLWRKVSREPDNCHGKDCRFYSICHYQEAKKEERRAHLIIANHHLFFANMASGWNVLAPFEAAVLDEAHEVERVASDYLGYEVSNTRLHYYLDNIISSRGKGLLSRLHWLSPEQSREISVIVDRLRLQGERYFNSVREFLSGENSMRLSKPGIFLDLLSEHLDQLHDELHTIYEASADSEEKKDIRTALERINSYKETLQAINDQTLTDTVYWAESEGRRVRLVATPLDVGMQLRAELFDYINPVVLTSATLSVGGSLKYMRERIGLDECNELILKSPFSYKEQAILYIPQDIPTPENKEFSSSLTSEIERLLRLVDGKTLVLFTSYAMMNQVLEGISDMGHPIFGQGDMDNYSLLEAFKASEKAALFGTYTFWQGIDLPGDLLNAVIITKLPFSVPTEPVTEARMEYLKTRGYDPFYSYQVPQAAIILKQGVGRLIRRKTDHGIIAILDSRVLKRRYGRSFLNSLPEMELITRFENLEEKMILKGSIQTPDVSTPDLI
ncbi:MAG: DEAD/DEAH box helicase [Nitrospirae bacterium]|nr:MAG: DEAD/DEAH box helicase [Nitrospirota bacterium]